MKRLVVLGLALFAGCSCGKGQGSRDAAPGSDAALASSDAHEAAAPEDPMLTDLWKRAVDGDDDDLARLCDREGSDRLMEAAANPARRLVALRALAFADDFTPLPFLAEMASAGTEQEATTALETAVAIADEPRRAVDPEDALELAEGTTRLLAFAKDEARPNTRRVIAVRALRILADRGALSPKDVPTSLDAK